jgi:ATP-dependent DNA helicase RecG
MCTSLYICLYIWRLVLDLSAIVAGLRAAGGDITSVEVKSAAGCLPETLTSTLSALANLPGGGTVILGLDERAGFRPVRLADAQALKQGLAAKARGFIPPVRLDIEDGIVDGAPVIVAQVSECDRSAKPCRVATSGKAYIRGYDGDFLLSDLEEQAFLAARRPPMFDRAPVDGATVDDLDEDLLEAFVASIRRNDPDGRGRFRDRDELLRRSGVLHPDGRPTVAGLLSLGIYPQQWFPRFVIQAAAEPLPGAQSGTRARNQVTIDGPIPLMLGRAMDWARRTFDTAIVTMPDGSVHDRYAYPLVAFRELIANALIHRDLDDWSAGLAIEVRLRRDRLVITNPGGLYGITVERLGREAVTSARNARLVAICQHVYSAETGARAIEALASGIPIVTDALAEAGLPSAHYIDSGITFTVILSQPAPSAVSAPPARDQVIFDALGDNPATVADLEVHTGLPGYTIRRSLRYLRERGLIEQRGGKGRITTYVRTKKNS